MLDEPAFYRVLLVAWAGLGLGAMIALLWLPAPYGRFFRPGWGPALSSNVGWMLMESPAAVVVCVLFAVGGRFDTASIVFFALFAGHYVYRGFLYPLRLHRGRVVSLFVVLSAIAFNVVNGYLQGRYLFTLSPRYPEAWLAGPRFVVGLVLFAAGFSMAVWTDTALRRLKAESGGGYRIPRGGPFRWVSCPNYLGELIEWTGWAVLTWSPPGAVFAFWTAANLVPRALAYHRWYREHFPDYPAQRKAILPYVL